jgi:hypothetical protein
MDAFDRLGTVCLVFACLVGAYFVFYLRNSVLLAVLLGVSVIPILWMLGLNVIEFLTRPFSEKGMKGIMSWIIVIILSIILYGLCFVGLRQMLVLLQVLR